MYKELEWDCASDIIKYQKIVEKERIFTFLVELNKNLDEVLGRILSTKPLPSLREACSEVQREKSRKKVMMKDHNSSHRFSSNDGSALATKGLNSQHFDSRRRSNKPWRDHCDRVGHTQETCWKIHGKPSNWKSNRTQENEPQDYHATNDEPPQSNNSTNKTPFSQEQMELLQKLLTRDPSSTSTTGSGFIAQKGICSKALNVFSKSNSWIIASGSSNHMTGDITLFHSYQPCSESYKIKIADGSYSPVAGKGSVIVPNSFRLLFVLHVPKLTWNLLSISKVTKDLNCVTKFFPNHCEFQEMEMGKMIGCAWEHEGLYIFGK